MMRTNSKIATLEFLNYYYFFFNQISFVVSWSMWRGWLVGRSSRQRPPGDLGT
jgi:hypothetical protein